MSKSNGKKVARKWLVDYGKKGAAEHIDPNHPLNSPEIRNARVKRAVGKSLHKEKAEELEREREWWRKGI